MYLEFFGLQENPFSLASDPRFLFYSEGHREAMAHLLYGVRERKGVILLVGEAGTGKTMLVRATLEMLRSTRVISSVIFNPLLGGRDDMLEAVLNGFGLAGFLRTTLSMASLLQKFLLQQTQAGRIPVLIMDEAQDLDRGFLEQIRLFSNFEFNGVKLLQVILAAQPEMAERLDTHELRALRQRIVVRGRLRALNAEETWRYIATRLTRAGGKGDGTFTPAAAGSIYRYSGGIPRLINTIADNCLLAGFAKGTATIEGGLVEEIAQHLGLSVADDSSGSVQRTRRDVIRASASWKEVVEDIRSAGAPESLQQFAEKLRVPEGIGVTPGICSTAMEREQ